MFRNVVYLGGELSRLARRYFLFHFEVIASSACLRHPRPRSAIFPSRDARERSVSPSFNTQMLSNEAAGGGVRGVKEISDDEMRG